MERAASERIDPTRCPLCGEPNGCARAAAAADVACDLPGRRAEADPCWCFERRFPATLLARARSRGAGAACVCAACLAEALRGAGAGADARASAGESARSIKLRVLR